MNIRDKFYSLLDTKFNYKLYDLNYVFMLELSRTGRISFARPGAANDMLKEISFDYVLSKDNLTEFEQNFIENCVRDLTRYNKFSDE